jgi:cytoskeletal protein RodZ
MVAGREIETLNSGNGNSSGHSDSGQKTDSAADTGDKPKNDRATTDDDRIAQAGEGPAAREADGANSANSVSESSKSGGDFEPSLGKTLAAARESRGLSRAQVAAESHIPAHYLQMIESSDYGLISDQLYLMPFLRRYAAFLKIDGEEVAMRFVREVQRAEGAAAMPRLSEPLAVHDRKRTQWVRLALIAFLVAAIIVLYIIASRHHREFTFHETPPAITSGAPAAPNSAAMPLIAAPPQSAPLTATGPKAAAASQTSSSGGQGAAAAKSNPPQPQLREPVSSKGDAAESKDSE